MLTCKDYVINRKLLLKTEVEDLKNKYHKDPCLCVVQIGDNPASNSYVNGKKRDCLEIGIEFKHIHLEEDSLSEEALIDKLIALSSNDSINGIIVQLPIPNKYNIKTLLKYIKPEKDVDGFRNDSCFKPCTPKGIIDWLHFNDYNLKGKFVTVIGRSDIVGKPLVNMLIEEQATVVCCNSKTSNYQMEKLMHMSDIIVSAIGKPKYFNKDNFDNPDVIVDVGINRDSNGKLCGDVDTEDVLSTHTNTCITPVPGGVGLLTRLSLMENTIEAFKLMNK